MSATISATAATASAATAGSNRSASDADYNRSNFHLGKFVLILAQLALLTVAVRQFQIESAAFLRVFILLCVSFGVHYLLPFRFRIHWFLVASLASIVVILGWTNGLWLIAIGLLLVTLCHLPIPYTLRVGLILLVAAGLAVLRTTTLELPFSAAVWPIIGSIFMYRLVVYLYDLKHDKVPAGVSHRLSYFFMLPNICFPLFPVIDSNDFRRLYYSEERHNTYQTGIEWITRGLIHLMLYRFVYYYLTVAPSEVLNMGDLAQFLVANFLLYLRVSGLFHLIIGILHLFGFSLPETHKIYYLSSSFTDFWRRINIYWKDFMMKVFYYPIYFRLKQYGATTALVVSTFIVFMLTWLLHSYQWFWLRGSFPLEWQDGAFWGILAVLVVINSVWEVKAGRARVLGRVQWHSRRSLIKSCQVLAVFTVICSLWSLWTSESFEEWAALWRVVSLQGLTLVHTLWTLLALALLVVVISVVDSAMNNARKLQLQAAGAGPYGGRRLLSGFASIVLLAGLGLPQVYTQFNASSANFVLSLRSEKLSRTDTAKLEKGYYEDLVRVDRFNSQLWELYAKKPIKNLDVMGSGLSEFTDDFLQNQLRSSARSITEYGAMTTNRWGMRDQDYPLAPAAGSYRIALLGASSVMGWGVGDEETFESLLEHRLNAQHSLAPAIDNIEILNMSVAGYYPLQQRMVLDKAFGFSPDAIYYVATGEEASRTADYLQDVVRAKRDIPYPYLRTLVEQAGLKPSLSRTEALQRLAPYQTELLGWLYREIGEQCRQRGILPVWVFLPQVNKGRWEESVAATEDAARAAGFTIINLLNVYDDYPIEQVQLSEWDFHPNKLGHQLVADRLFDALTGSPGQFLARPAMSAAASGAHLTGGSHLAGGSYPAGGAHSTSSAHPVSGAAATGPASRQ